MNMLSRDMKFVNGFGEILKTFFQSPRPHNSLFTFIRYNK